MPEGFCGSGVWGTGIKRLFSKLTPLAGGLFTEPGCQSTWKGASSILALRKRFKHLLPGEHSRESSGEGEARQRSVAGQGQKGLLGSASPAEQRCGSLGSGWKAEGASPEQRQREVWWGAGSAPSAPRQELG